MRPSANDLLKHPFLENVKDTSKQFLRGLIDKTIRDSMLDNN